MTRKKRKCRHYTFKHRSAGRCTKYFLLLPYLSIFGSCSNLWWRHLHFPPRLFPPCIIWMLSFADSDPHQCEKLDPDLDPHQRQSQKQDPDHFDEVQDFRNHNCFKVKSRILICLKVKRGIRICIIIKWCGSATLDTSSAVCTVGKSMLAAYWKAALSLVVFSCGSATLDAPSADM